MQTPAGLPQCRLAHSCGVPAAETAGHVKDRPDSHVQIYLLTMRPEPNFNPSMMSMPAECPQCPPPTSETRVNRCKWPDGLSQAFEKWQLNTLIMLHGSTRDHASASNYVTK